MVLFAHLADLHIGGWRDEKLKSLGLEAFELAVTKLLEVRPDFVVIAGDIFNTALPSIDAVRHATVQLSRLREARIPVYFIAGSHDYSASGKSMLHVLEGAGLAIDVQRAHYTEAGLIRLEFTTDARTGVKLAGLPGKKGALESQYYDVLDRDAAAAESGTKVFLFHMLLDEFRRAKDEHVPATPSSVLPHGFSYYAGGHPHLVDHKRFDSGTIAYPGPLFPNNFEELEELGSGGFYLVDLDSGALDWQRVLTRPVVRIRPKPFSGSPADLEETLMREIRGELAGSIVLLRVEGELTGPISEVDWARVQRRAFERGAYAFAKNTYKLSSKAYERTEVIHSSQREIESEMTAEFAEKTPAPQRLGDRAYERLFSTLHTAKQEGETNADFERRVLSEFSAEFGIDL